MLDVTLQFTTDAESWLETLRSKTHAGDYAELIGNALRLYGAIVEDTEAGHRWLTRTPNAGIQPYNMFGFHTDVERNQG